MKSSAAFTEIRIAVIGAWVPSQLADVLALQRAEEPETAAMLIAGVISEPARAASGGDFDFAVSTTELEWPSWECEPLWYDTLTVAAAKRSHLLGYSEVPHLELLKQPVINVQSTAGEPWYAVANQLFTDAKQNSERMADTFDIAMTLVAAGYGITIAPMARLVGYQCRGVAIRPVADMPRIVSAYMLQPRAALSEHLQRFARRLRSIP